MRADILKSLTSYCDFKGGRMLTTLTGENLREVYTLFREAILNGEIPLNKAVGFKLYSTTSMENLAAIDRHTACLENMIQLSKNISKLIFISPTGFVVTSYELTGDAYSGNINFTSDGTKIEVLDNSIYLFNSIEPLGVRIFAHENIGYRSMEENVEIMKTVYNSDREESSTFFPLNTEHVLVDYVNVLPFDGKEIRYKISKNFKEEDLKILWNRYLERWKS